MQKNVFGEPLVSCCFDPITGVTRSGYCESLNRDKGKHIVCAYLTDEFLQFSLSMGNDLMTPQPQWGFLGLKEGDFWCLCVSRWMQAYKAGCAPPLKLEACHYDVLHYIKLEELIAFNCSGNS